MNPWSRRLGRLTPAARRQFRLQMLLLEERAAPTSLVESITGAGNNVAHPTWGSASTDLIRIAPAAYADGISVPAGTNRPSARDISNALSDQTNPANPSQDLNMPNAKGLSDYIYVFGQFLDHDLDLTTTNSGESFDIPTTQAGDPFNPPGTMPFTRSTFDTATGTSAANPRQQVNSVTSFLDGSQVYGSDATRADALRTHVGGRLKTDPGNLLPHDTAANFPSGTVAMANDANIVSSDKLFAAGDVRANENIELTAMQTVFVREHNRIAGQLQADHPSWSDEQLYQAARRTVIAELQIITYNEWLPALLGANALSKYTGYKPNVNASISNEFSTAMFRFAHSQLDNGVDRLNNNGTDSAAGGVDLAYAFFNPTLINPAGVTDPFSGAVSTGVDPILKGAASGDAQEVDLQAVRDIRNLLFGAPGAGGSDLIARDIQRGRDHGLTDYNSMRVAYGLPAVANFAQITSDAAVQQKLQQLYGNVNNIDAFVGALAEDHAAGADVGPLTKAVLVDQFTRLRDGDRFFYLNQFSGQELNNLVANTSLTKIIERNSGVTNLQANAFYFRSSISGTVSAVTNRSVRGRPSSHPLAGLTVQLKDDSGAVLATAITDNGGRYRFDYLNGLYGTGDYSVQLVAPANTTETSPDPVTLLISRGDVNATVNFSLMSNGWSGWSGGDSAWSDPFDGWTGRLRHSDPAPGSDAEIR